LIGLATQYSWNHAWIWTSHHCVASLVGGAPAGRVKRHRRWSCRADARAGSTRSWRPRAVIARLGAS